MNALQHNEMVTDALLANNSPSFFSENGGPMVDVNTLVLRGSDIEVIDAVDINDRGEIAGGGVLLNGDFHAVVLIPCDRNHSDTKGCENAETARLCIVSRILSGKASATTPC